MKEVTPEETKAATQAMADRLQDIADQMRAGELVLTGTGTISSHYIPPDPRALGPEPRRHRVTVFFQAERELPDA